MERIRIRFVLLAILISLLAIQCEDPTKESGNGSGNTEEQTVTAEIEEFFVPSGIWIDDTLRISFKGKLADSSCYALADIELVRTDTSAEFTIWGERLASANCEPIPISFKIVDYVIPPPYTTPFKVKFNQPDSTIIEKLVNVVLFDPDVPKIAFESDRDGYGPSHVLLMDTDGQNMVNITKYDGGGYRPRFTPNGTKIVFISYRDGPASLYIMDVDGNNPIRLVESGFSSFDYAISPDGSRIAYSVWEGSNSRIRIYNLVDNTITAVQSSSGNMMWPDFSPDGSQIAYNNGQIFVANIDGTGETTLTNNPSRTIHPRYSPDGDKITYLFGPISSNIRDLYVMSSDGSNQTNLTETDIQEWEAWFFPLGDRLLYEAWDYEHWSLYVIGVDGSGSQRITDNTFNAGDPSISTDGSKIIFRYSNDQTNIGGIYQINPDGSGLQALTDYNLTDYKYDRYPQFQPQQ